jgi:sugar phosphate isomerase/epimerase
MKLLTGAVLMSLAASTFAQPQTTPPAQGGQRRGGGGGGGAQAQQPPAFQSAPDALEQVTFRTRTMLSTSNRATNWINWRFGIAANGFGNLTFQEAIVRADAAQVNFIEGSNGQRVSAELSKNLDYNLTPEEIATVRRGMGGIRMTAYRVDNLGADAASRRKTLEFAKALNADIVVGPLGTSDAAELDQLATELEINVALTGRPDAILQALEGRSRRLSIAADTGVWMQYNRTPLQALANIKDRLTYISLRDRSALGAEARNVMLG